MRRFRKKYKPHTKEENQGFALLIIAGVILIGIGSAWTRLFQTSHLSGFLALLIGLLIVVIAAIFIVFGQRWIRRKIVLNTTLARIDRMSGTEFEHFVAKLLQEKGYQTQMTATTGDFGIDIIAHKDNISTAVQIKRYTAAVGVEAVYQVVGGKKYYHCPRCMVITSSTFTPAARKLASVHFCTLVDRTRLAEWMEQVQKKLS